MPSAEGIRKIQTASRGAFLSGKQAAAFGDAVQHFEIQKAPVFSNTEQEFYASYDKVAPYIRNGDGMWYSGALYHPLSFVIKVATMSNVSHCGYFGRLMYGGKDDEGHEKWDVANGTSGKGLVRILDIVEGQGGRNVDAGAEIKRYPGCYYWAPVQRERYPEFDDQACVQFMLDLYGTKYGWAALSYMACWHAPIAREFTYLLFHNDIDKAFVNQPPFCSDAMTMAAIAGGVNPVPGRASQLVAPADTHQSLLWLPSKVALY
jgi:hypothetical protein